MTEPSPAAALHPVRVWDLPTRAFHWALALAVAVTWLSGEFGMMEVHLPAGLCVLALVVFRLFWGVLGSDSARFAKFLRGPGAVLSHLGHLIARRPDHTPTHNPLGGYAVLLLLGVLLVQGASGLFADDEILTTGYLSAYVPGVVVRFATWLHVLGSKAVLAVVLLHLAAIAIYRFWARQDLVSPMVTGIKPLPAGTAAPRLRSTWLAVALFLLCAAAARGIAALGG